MGVQLKLADVNDARHVAQRLADHLGPGVIVPAEFPAQAGLTVEIRQDRLPRAGEHDGLFYAMGFSGHGAQMSVHLGQQMARVMGGEAEANPFRRLPWRALPFNWGTPWFLPAVGAYYRLMDRLH